MFLFLLFLFVIYFILFFHPAEHADVIPDKNITIEPSNHTARSVKVSWIEPESPNGLIVKYYLEYRRTDVPNVKFAFTLFFFFFFL